MRSVAPIERSAKKARELGLDFLDREGVRLLRPAARRGLRRARGGRGRSRLGFGAHARNRRRPCPLGEGIATL
jgi:hypothetical protein